jgi:2-keto-4-pentenoate hydratase
MKKKAAQPTRAERAARLLLDAHGRKASFAPLPAELAPHTVEAAYDIQDALVARKSETCGPVAGWKIALTTPQMRAMVGVNDSIGGTLHKGQIQKSPGRVRAADYAHLIVEFEVGVQLAEDLPAADAPYTRERVAKAVGAVMPALEIADDWNADYKTLAQHALQLAADNAWNEGAVLGAPVADWQPIDLGGIRGVAMINGKLVGEGHGRDAMGHPFESLAWVANHLAQRGLGLWRGAVVITGSLVTSKFPVAGDEIRFDLGALGAVELKVE